MGTILDRQLNKALPWADSNFLTRLLEVLDMCTDNDRGMLDFDDIRGSYMDVETALVRLGVLTHREDNMYYVNNNVALLLDEKLDALMLPVVTELGDMLQAETDAINRRMSGG